MIKVKQGDTHSIYFRVYDSETGLPVDLTDLQSAQGFVRLHGQAPIPISVTVWGSPVDGMFVHKLTGSLIAGTYSLVVKIKKNDEQTTAPTDEFDCLVVGPNFGADL